MEKMIVFKKRKGNGKRFKFRKKHLYMLYMSVLVLLEPVLMCGCAAAHDDIVMEISDTGFSDDSENMTEVSELEEETRMVYVYVCGAVELPGVYCLGQGSRLYEAVEMAGGLTGDADDTCLNMAREIADGEQVVILTQEETLLLKESGMYSAGESGQETASGDAGLVNINTATVAELTSVSGIGESRAQAIIDYREKNGSFRSIEDIKKVEGIKDGLFSKIKDKIKI